MEALIALQVEATRAGAPALALLLGIIAADLAARGVVYHRERVILARGLARHEVDGSTALARLYRRAVAAVEEIVQPAPVEMAEAA